MLGLAAGALRVVALSCPDQARPIQNPTLMAQGQYGHGQHVHGRMAAMCSGPPAILPELWLTRVLAPPAMTRRFLHEVRHPETHRHAAVWHLLWQGLAQDYRSGRWYHLSIIAFPLQDDQENYDVEEV